MTSLIDRGSRAIHASCAAACLLVAGLTIAQAAPAESGSSPRNVRCGDTASLIAAIDAANAAAVPSTIRLAPSRLCSFTLTAPTTTGGPNAGGADGLPIILGNVTLEGGTITRSDAAGVPLFRIFEVAKGASLTLNGVTVTGGRLHGPGAGIFVDGRIKRDLLGLEQPGVLTLAGSVIRSNTSTDGFKATGSPGETLGGGINNRGTTTITDTLITTNTVSESRPNPPGGEVVAEGGGLVNSGTMTITRSRVTDNHAISTNDQNLGAFGGGLGSFSDVDFVAPAFLTITDSVISGNTTTGRYAEGAAMEIELDTTITRTRITGNVSNAGGDNSPPPCSFGLAQCNSGSAYADGAILNQGHVTLTDSVIAGNRSTATGSPHALVEGAGLTNSGTFSVTSFRPVPGTADLVRTIVTGNAATALGSGSEVRGGGIANADQNTAIPGRPPSLSLINSLVAANTAIASQAHGGGIDNFLNSVLQHSPRGIGEIALAHTPVVGNRPDNCEPLASISGCRG